MNKPLYLIYVTGLGDVQEPRGQLRAVNRWPRYGVQAELFQMRWADKEPWQPKFERLLARIDERLEQGYAVGLVGVSAGASAVINAFAARKDVVVGCVLIAAKVNRPNFIRDNIQRENPAFVQSAHVCETALKTLDQVDRKRILNRYALIDETVYKPDSRIPGAHNRIVPSIGHFITIASQITLGAPGFIRFLKRLQSSKNAYPAKSQAHKDGLQVHTKRDHREG